MLAVNAHFSEYFAGDAASDAETADGDTEVHAAKINGADTENPEGDTEGHGALGVP
jgi:hypothetical protein